MRAILTWHSIDASGSPISVAPALFRQQLAWIREARLRVVPVGELLALPPDANAIAITFDDGFANFASEALPLLEEHALLATVFIVTGHVGGDNKWRGTGDAGIPVLPLLGWDELARLHASGITLAAHTRTHPRLPALGAAAIRDELGVAADEMEQRFGVRPLGLAYPYGAVDARVVAVTAPCYTWACTTEFRALGANDPVTMLPRLDAWYFREARQFSEWGTANFRAWMWYRRQGRRARSALRALGAA